jgi:hypothetical protein
LAVTDCGLEAKEPNEIVPTVDFEVAEKQLFGMSTKAPQYVAMQVIK